MKSSVVAISSVVNLLCKTKKKVMFSLKLFGIVVWILLSIVEVELMDTGGTNFHVGESSNPYKKIPDDKFIKYVSNKYGKKNHVELDLFMKGVTFAEHGEKTKFKEKYVQGGNLSPDVYKLFNPYHKFVTDLYNSVNKDNKARYRNELMTMARRVHGGYALALGREVMPPPGLNEAEEKKESSMFSKLFKIAKKR
ncbi:uncharacterized protein PHALS_04751 [Plasmopara halstedii]|uniref:Uncharacterized protein n=1 Tax=Plasmopara halstedii TaxID=4781 RepID=A0A0P1AYP7_PLAHL|nr:uncharacterized protein PHALS_04751 [Plasmopara halstedii]CEG47600.1 hypothetical protein PHALS_04751 [Plasmopara halstedii]|eukprot:XP_024583969.1 hypothetical protein PHALS_04751 [Plasmopara halstedii]